jgi:hypothetical protein
LSNDITERNNKTMEHNPTPQGRSEAASDVPEFLKSCAVGWLVGTAIGFAFRCLQRGAKTEIACQRRLHQRTLEAQRLYRRGE